MKTQSLKTMHTAITMLFAAYKVSAKSERSDYDAMMRVVKTAPLQDAEQMKAVCKDTFETFGEAHKDAAQIRVNILNNARKVAHGGAKDGKHIKGKGVATLLEVCASVSSIRELKKALSDAKPDALKGESGGDRKGKKGKGAKTSNPLSVPKVATREEAMAAARKILEFVRDKFTKPSETVLCEQINKTCELLK
jgi:hypothetical protein